MTETARGPEAETVARPNLAAVAARAGVSASTASLAFSGAGPVSEGTRSRVLAAAEELGYAGPDPRGRSLRRGRSGIVGVVIEDRLRDAFRDPMNVAMLDGLADATGAVGEGILLLTDAGGGVVGLDSAPVDAVVFLGCSTRLSGSIAAFRQRGVPLVAIEAEHLEGIVPIDLDNTEGSARLARHLADLGHADVAVVTLPLDPAHGRGPLTPEREAASTGFVASARIAGVRQVFPAAGGWAAASSSVEEGMLAGHALLDDAADRPTAIVAQSDLLAEGVIHAARELGLRVPEELSVVGFDGVRLEGIAPLELTTMVQPAVDKGRAAGEAILAMLAGEPGQARSFTSVFRAGSTVAGPRP